MTRPLALLAALAGLALPATSAQAAAPKCNRGGAQVLAVEGGVSVVSVTPKQKGNTVPKDKVYGCWNSSGKRFELFEASLSDEQDTWDIVDGRYIGVFRDITEGVAGSTTAASWDARKRVALYTTGPCDGIQAYPTEDESSFGPVSAVVFRGGGLAYTCGDDTSHIVDAKGDRALEPAGTVVAGLAVTPSGNRLYYFAGDNVKTVEV